MPTGTFFRFIRFVREMRIFFTGRPGRATPRPVSLRAPLRGSVWVSLTIAIALRVDRQEGQRIPRRGPNRVGAGVRIPSGPVPDGILAFVANHWQSVSCDLDTGENPFSRASDPCAGNGLLCARTRKGGRRRLPLKSSPLSPREVVAPTAIAGRGRRRRTVPKEKKTHLPGEPFFCLCRHRSSCWRSPIAPQSRGIACLGH
jgi:hypothetical protein